MVGFEAMLRAFNRIDRVHLVVQLRRHVASLEPVISEDRELRQERNAQHEWDLIPLEKFRNSPAACKGESTIHVLVESTEQKGIRTIRALEISKQNMAMNNFIPAVKMFADFRTFSQAGRDLAHWQQFSTPQCPRTALAKTSTSNPCDHSGSRDGW
jgi:hypothetical protein